MSTFIVRIVSTTSLLAALVAPAANGAASGYDEEVVVTGQRLSQLRSIERKRLAPTILDAVSADELGQLPDRNAAEVIDRLPGVSITVDQGEGRYVSIRGISPDLSQITINGVAAGSPEADGGGRPAPLDVIGSDLLEAIEVIKLRTPDMDGQGIGGAVNVITQSAFDRRERMFGFGSVRAGTQDKDDSTPYSAEFTVGGRNRSDTVGLLLGGSYDTRDFESNGVYQDDWREVTLDGVTSDIPENAKNTEYQLERTRKAANVALELRPTADDHLFARVYWSRFEEDEERQRYEHFFSRDITELSANAGVSGTDNRREQDLRVEQKDKEFMNLAVGGEHALSANLMGDWVAQLNRNEQEEPNGNWEFRGDGYGPDAWVVDGEGLVRITPGPVDVLDPSLLEFRRVRFQDNRTEEDGLIIAGNLAYTFDQLGGVEIKGGVKYSRTDRDNDASQVRYDAGEAGWTLADGGQAGRTFANEVDGKDFPMLTIDAAAAQAFFEANRNDPAVFELNDGDTFDAEHDSDYEVLEEVYAAYGMISADLNERLNLLGGLRFERTEVESDAFTRDGDNEAAQPVEGSGEYDHLLPTVIATFRPEERWIVRAGYTRSLGRPDYDQIAPISELSRDGAEGELSIGNADLEARVSDNVDVSVEFYPGELSVLSVAAFYKRIDDFIVRRTDSFTDFTFNGETFERFDIVTLENAEEADLQGVEFRVDHQFVGAPGLLSNLGIQLAYTVVDSELEVAGRDDELPLQLQPDWTRTLGLTWQSERLQAVLTWNETDAFLSSIEDTSDADLYAGEYQRLDLKTSYRLNPNVDLFLEWLNITDEPTLEYQNRTRRNTQFEEYGWTLYVGSSIRF